MNSPHNVTKLQVHTRGKGLSKHVIQPGRKEESCCKSTHDVLPSLVWSESGKDCETPHTSYGPAPPPPSPASRSPWTFHSSKGGLPREHRLNDNAPDAPDLLATGDPLWPDHRSTLTHLSDPTDSKDKVQDIPAGNGTARELTATSDLSQPYFKHVDCKEMAVGRMTTTTGPTSVDQDIQDR